MTSFALDIFHRCLEQVDEVESAARRAEAEGPVGLAPILRRSAYVLAVAALDSYFHERGILLLRDRALASVSAAGDVANFVQSVSALDVSGPNGESYIRLRLSFRTLVAPASIDRLLAACALDPDDHWLRTAFTLGTRPDRLRRLLELVYDRRNLIAHEGDWDMIDLDFRPMEQAHLADCVTAVRNIAETMDTLL
jgi:hypothetical protein